MFVWVCCRSWVKVTASWICTQSSEFGAPPTPHPMCRHPTWEPNTWWEALLECVMNVHHSTLNVYPSLKYNKALCFLPCPPPQLSSPFHPSLPTGIPGWNMFELLITMWFISEARATGDLGGDADRKVESKRQGKKEEGGGGGGSFDLSLWANYEHDPRDLTSLCLAFPSSLSFSPSSLPLSRAPLPRKPFTYTVRCWKACRK